MQLRYNFSKNLLLDQISLHFFLGLHVNIFSKVKDCDQNPTQGKQKKTDPRDKNNILGTGSCNLARES